jgi:hypothetical protein
VSGTWDPEGAPGSQFGRVPAGSETTNGQPGWQWTDRTGEPTGQWVTGGTETEHGVWPIGTAVPRDHDAREVSTPLEPVTAQYPASDHAASAVPVWDPESETFRYPEPPAPTASTVPLAPTAQDQWIPVDPSSYSNPYTDAPIYTSGPQPAVSPDAQPAPAPPAGFGPPVAYPPAPPGTAHAAPWVPQAPLAEPGGYAVPAAYPAAPGQPVNPAAPTTPGSYSLVAPVPGAGPSDPVLAPDHQPEKGELKIKERRSWRTWQLLAAVLVAAVVGMWFNGNSGSASGIPGSGSGGSSGGYKLPPAAGSPSTTVAAAGGAATSTTAAGGATTTTAAGTATSTTAAGTTATTAPVVLAPASVLVPETQQAGNWTSPAFTIAGGTWNIGWAFQCVPVPTVTPTFQIFVVNNGASPGATPAVTSSAASGSAVTPLTSAGGQQVIVQTSAACRWAVKVTGSGS